VVEIVCVTEAPAELRAMNDTANVCGTSGGNGGTMEENVNFPIRVRFIELPNDCARSSTLATFEDVVTSNVIVAPPCNCTGLCTIATIFGGASFAAIGTPSGIAGSRAGAGFAVAAIVGTGVGTTVAAAVGAAVAGSEGAAVGAAVAAETVAAIVGAAEGVAASSALFAEHAAQSAATSAKTRNRGRSIIRGLHAPRRRA
jgi:hypothetical protein